MTQSNMIKAIGWFKEQFRSKIEVGTAGTPFTLDLLTAIALQETYYLGKALHKIIC
jgi:hypothetical protein